MAMEIPLTESQRDVIEFKPSGNLLIRGEAGSGKTTVLAARADWIESQVSRGTMLFLTYNQALAENVKHLLQLFGVDESVEVKTIHTWCKEFALSLGSEIGPWVFDKRREALVEIIKKECSFKWIKNHLFNESLSFWNQEISWILGQGITRRETYYNCQRVGRGTAIPVRGDDREFIWDLFEEYVKKLEESNEIDIEDIGGMVRRAVQKNNKMFPSREQYDHVFVDEVQDFNLAWLKAIAPIPRMSLTLAGDLAQRIYRRNFTWKETGIKIHASHSKKLEGSHRTTRQIMQVATHIATNWDLKNNADYQEPTIPTREGPKVAKIERDKWWRADEEAARRAATLFRENPKDSIVIAVQFHSQKERFKRRLTDIGVYPKIVTRGDLGRVISGVVITTFHQLKGLEFEHIFLTGLGDSTMPAYYYKLGGSEREEEKEEYLRRLIYVAMTRAKTSVTLVGESPFCRYFNQVPDLLIEDL